MDPLRVMTVWVSVDVAADMMMKKWIIDES